MSTARLTSKLEDSSHIYNPWDWVTQLYPDALGTHFGRILRHAWATVGLFFNPIHQRHTEENLVYNAKIFQEKTLHSLIKRGLFKMSET